MSGATKRKRHSFTDPSTIAPIKHPTVDTQPRRSTLQRASKDRAYAERLAAGGDAIGSFNGSTSASNGNTDPRKSSLKYHASKVKGSKSIKKEVLPPGWPFVDTFSKKHRGGKSREKQSAGSGGKLSIDRQPKSPHQHLVEGSDLPVLTRRQSNVLLSSNQHDILEEQKLPASSTSRSRGANHCKYEIDSNSKRKNSPSKQSIQSLSTLMSPCNECRLSSSGRCSKCRACRSSSEGGSVEDITVTAEMSMSHDALFEDSVHFPTDESLKVEGTKSSTQHACSRSNEQLPSCESARCDQDYSFDKPENEATNKSPTSHRAAKTWDCTRCTLTNSNRRKKCQVCGNIRHLSVTSEGTFVLSDGIVDSGAVLSSAAGSSRGDLTVANGVELEPGNHLQNGSSQNEFSSANDLFAIAAEPVSTRSRFKQSRLSQSMTQSEEDLNGSQQSLSAFDSLNKQDGGECDATRKHQDSFLKHIKKHKKNRLDRRKAKRVKRQLEITGKVQVSVRVSVSAGDTDMKDVSLIAYIPSEIMPFVFYEKNEPHNVLDAPRTAIECIDRKREIKVRLSLEGEVMGRDDKLDALVPVEIMPCAVDHLKESSRAGCKDIKIFDDALKKIDEKTNDNVNDATDEVQSANETAVDIQERQILRNSFTNAENTEITRCKSKKDGVESSLKRVELDAAEVLSRMQVASGGGVSSPERNDAPTDTESKQSLLQFEQKAEHSDGKQLMNREFIEGSDNIQYRGLELKDIEHSSGAAVGNSVKQNDEFVELSYIPMTQQTSEFDYDYYSQASKDSNKCETSVRKVTESKKNRDQGSENKVEPTSISSSYCKPFRTTKSNYSSIIAASCEVKQKLQRKQSDRLLDEGHVDIIKEPSNARIYPTGKKISVDVSDETLSKVSKLFEDEISSAAVANEPIAGGAASELNPQILDSSSTSDNSTVRPVFQTAGNETAIAVTDESLSKASELFECSEPTSRDFSARRMMVQTGGKKRTIQVSEETLSNASKLLNDGSVPETFLSPENRDITMEKNLVTSNQIKPACNSTSLPMFQTARSNSVINVSKDSMSKAGLFIRDESITETCTVSHKPMAMGSESSSNDGVQDKTVAGVLNPTAVPIFQTAGTNTVIRVSDESMSKISHLFDNDTYKTETAIASDAFSTSSNEKRDEIIDSRQTPIAFCGFQTAGRKTVIDVSDESLAMVNKLFQNDLPSSTAAELVDQLRVSNDEENMCHHNSSALPASPSVFVGFQTAGQKTAIKISDESQSLVDKFFGFDEFNTETRTVAGGTSQKNTERNFAAGRPNVARPPALPMFQTARKNKAIKVTEAALSKVSKLFTDDSRNETNKRCSVDKSSMADSAIDFDDQNEVKDRPRAIDSSLSQTPKTPGVPMFQTAGKKYTVKVSDESLSKANVFWNVVSSSHVADGILPSRATDIKRDAEGTEVVPSVPLFQTAGTKNEIKFSDESLLKVNRFVRNDGSDIGACVDSTSAAEHSYSIGDVKVSFLNKDAATTPEPTFPMFQTKQIAINVPDEVFTRVNNPFQSDAFTSLLVSAELPSSFNQSTEVPAESSTNASTCLCTAGQKAAIDVSDHHGVDSDDKVAVKSFATETSFDDQSELRQSTGRSKKSNRVRFSLDPTELRVVQNSVDHHEGSDGRQSKIETEDLGSFITPDKRQLDGDLHSSSSDTVVQSGRSNEVHSNAIDGPSSAYPSNIYTPLHRQTGRDSIDMQSEIKSKRLFDAANDNQSQLNASPQISSRAQRWASGANQRSSNKVNLGRFSLINATRAKCLDNGVSDVTLRINYTNANKLRFGSTDGLPLFIVGQRDVPRGGNVGKVSDIKEWLIEHGCDESLFSNKWISNHYQMIVWKLAAMEWSFSDALGGQYLVYEHVLKQMKDRYEKELRLAKRPPVRKLLNRDVSASMPIILCVSQILRFRTKTDKPGVNKEEARLELTDGWYTLPATPDSVLLQFVEKQKIKVGTKLMICNAQLLGSEDGVDPLDDSYSSTKRDCPLCLNINANSTRLARWDAMLGFVSPKNSRLDAGSLIVKSLRDIFIDGGSVPAMDLVVCKQYPKMYLEEINGSSLHLTEAENAARQIEYNSKHQRASEKIADMAQKECIEELDEEAPEQWKEMQCSNSPTEYYEKLGTFEKKVVDEWANKRGVLLQNMISRSIEDSLKDDPSAERKSKSYVKLLVKAFSPSSTSTEKHTSPAAELTIWRVSDDQFDLVKEGSVVRFRNLVVKSRSKCGILQLSANHETPMEALLEQPTDEQLIQSGYSHRVPRSFIQLNIAAKQQIGVKNDIEHEFDLVACVVQVSKVSDNTSDAYLTDESGIVVKVRRDHKADNSDPFSLGNSSLPTVVAYCNLRISSFDEDEHCVVAAWQVLSCKSNRLMQDRCEELYSWCNSDDGVKCCSIILDKINAGIPFGTDNFIKTKVCFGYIMSVEEGHAAGVNIAIDYGVGVVKASISSHIVHYAIQLFERGCKSDTPLLVGVPLLKYTMQNNQKLLRFVLKEASSYGGESPVQEVIGLSIAQVDALARLHL